jgi:hypothetical protein
MNRIMVKAMFEELAKIAEEKDAAISARGTLSALRRTGSKIMGKYPEYTPKGIVPKRLEGRLIGRARNYEEGGSGVRRHIGNIARSIDDIF